MTGLDHQRRAIRDIERLREPLMVASQNDREETEVKSTAE
jgi:hypothetical protein